MPWNTVGFYARSYRGNPPREPRAGSNKYLAAPGETSMNIYIYMPRTGAPGQREMAQYLRSS